MYPITSPRGSRTQFPRFTGSKYALVINNSPFLNLLQSSSPTHLCVHTHISEHTQTHIQVSLLYLYGKVNPPSSNCRTLLHCYLAVHFEQCSPLLCVTVQLEQCTKCVAFQWKMRDKVKPAASWPPQSEATSSLKDTCLRSCLFLVIPKYVGPHTSCICICVLYV